MTEALYSYKNPLPQVDPYFTEDNPKVNQMAMRTVSPPSDLTRDKDRFVASLVDVAFMVHEVRDGASWRHIEEAMKNTTSTLPKELQKWCGLNMVHTFARPVDLAEYVHDDVPAALHFKIDEYLQNSAKADRLVFNTPSSGEAHFHRGRLAADALKSIMPLMVNPTAFAIKYKYKVPRPHRAISDILNGDVEVDARDMRTLQRLCAHPEQRLAAPMEDFTIIKNATPNHWSYVAMHATNAGAARLVAAVTRNHAPNSHADRQVCQALAQNGMGRMALGVHTGPDNVEGFRAGQTIGYEVIPELMHQFADADPDKVRRRLDDFMMEF